MLPALGTFLLCLLIPLSCNPTDERRRLRERGRLPERRAGLLGHTQHPRDEGVPAQTQGGGLPRHRGVPLALQPGVHTLAGAHQGECRTSLSSQCEILNVGTKVF